MVGKMDNGEHDDDTPVERAPKNPANHTLVMAVGSHILVLEQVRTSLRDLRNDWLERETPVAAAEYEKLGRVFRHEGDSAHQTARFAEDEARRPPGKLRQG